MAVKKLEVQLLAEASGGYYDEDDIDEIIEICKDVDKHVGFKDNRRDKRFIVKFPDIFYYIPEEYARKHEHEIDYLFGDFCWEQQEWIKETLKSEGISVGDLLNQHSFCGHYQTFALDIPEITEENVIQIAINIFDEFDYYWNKYASNYVRTVDLLQDLEDNYMEYWFEFLEGLDSFPKKLVNEMKYKYRKDMERRKAKQTLAK